MAILTVPHNHVFKVPADIAVCPYCKAKLTAQADAWSENEDGTWGLSDEGVHAECMAEPDIESKEWDDWLEQHTYMPYVYQLPVDQVVTMWINANFRFDMDKSEEDDMPEITEKDKARIENTFTYHAPKGNQQERYEEIRNKAKQLAYTIAADCPESREKSLAMTNLEQAVMWANAAIARNE